ncbi:hypothetical protein BLNAU_7871 [Blattamonas nauphoetae]|uniref:Uncharacterized protein n=1 Tax=Blattamonas nauphoetae TaxID=2049346 RepID=A0ABQ9XZX4_9EUKA|nr:hypothetical protein BLNAU_7871 [Blattamonas nauphoetae]
MFSEKELNVQGRFRDPHSRFRYDRFVIFRNGDTTGSTLARTCFLEHVLNHPCWYMRAMVDSGREEGGLKEVVDASQLDWV